MDTDPRQPWERILFNMWPSIGFVLGVFSAALLLAVAVRGAH